MTSRTRKLARFAPPLVWMGVIAVLSGSLFGADRTESWVLAILRPLLPWADLDTLRDLRGVLRKMGHVVEYGILALLWQRALAADRLAGRAAASALALSGLYAITDEARQGLTPNRSPSAWDVGFDTAGAFLALAAWGAWAGLWRAVIRLVRWAAAILAVGSLAVAVVDSRLGLPVRDLLLAALGLGVSTWALGRAERADARHESASSPSSPRAKGV